MNEERHLVAYQIGDRVAGGRVDIVYDHDCPRGHVIRGAMGLIPCPYCAVRRAERVEKAARRARNFLQDFHCDNQREVIEELDSVLQGE